MSSRRSFWLGLILSLLAGLMTGAAGSAYFTYGKTRSYFGSEWLYEQSRDVQESLTLLKLLRSGNQKEALENLESRLDDDLISMQPDEFISERTTGEINKAVDAAKNYRLNYPRKSQRRFVDRMVQNVFERGFISSQD